jgi:hypothetical protein
MKRFLIAFAVISIVYLSMLLNLFERHTNLKDEDKGVYIFSIIMLMVAVISLAAWIVYEYKSLEAGGKAKQASIFV